jgi:hypothetical protein
MVPGIGGRAEVRVVVLNPPVMITRIEKYCLHSCHCRYKLPVLQAEPNTYIWILRGHWGSHWHQHADDADHAHHQHEQGGHRQGTCQEHQHPQN